MLAIKRCRFVILFIVLIILIRFFIKTIFIYTRQSIFLSIQFAAKITLSYIMMVKIFCHISENRSIYTVFLMKVSIKWPKSYKESTMGDNHKNSDIFLYKNVHLRSPKFIEIPMLNNCYPPTKTVLFSCKKPNLCRLKD